MAETYNDALEWAAKWIEDTLRAGPETDERTIEFGTNMAMTLRAARVHPVDDAQVEEIRDRNSKRRSIDLGQLYSDVNYLLSLLPNPQLSSSERASVLPGYEAALREVNDCEKCDLCEDHLPPQ